MFFKKLLFSKNNIKKLIYLCFLIIFIFIILYFIDLFFKKLLFVGYFNISKFYLKLKKYIYDLIYLNNLNFLKNNKLKII